MKKRKMGKKHSEVKSRKVNMRRFIKFFPPYILLVAFVLPVLAAEEPVEKLSGGVKEAATGWTEVPKEMADTTQEKNVVEGVTVGAIEGAGKAVVNTTKGVVNAATFYLPDDDKVEEKNEYMDEHIDGSLNKDVDEEMIELDKINATEY